MDAMSPQENEEYLRILGKKLLIDSVVYFGNSTENLPEALLVTPEEQAFYDKWLPVKLALNAENFAREERAEQAHRLTKRQKANAKRREAKYGTTEPRLSQKWLHYTEVWLKLRFEWIEKPEVLGFVRELVCVTCREDKHGYCEYCEAEDDEKSSVYVAGLRWQSLREEENRFLARYGEPEIHL